ncbi:hypothetical protein [Longimicrobium sp.]|uniref:hypothetical protein n=1 Tax=Longimicrobium sp. TaxID=2029185 RepID=UPI002E322773|nr:hypothetical protein [Longimicrobium sp.]HEX6037387.1 hypothetical protein [Longimicrobium sp.]
MLTLALSMIQAPARTGVNVTNTLVIVAVLAAVGLVIWASRPSTIEKYSADRTQPPAEKETRG